MNDLQKLRSKVNNLKVLVVDDDEVVLNSTARYLSKIFDVVDSSINANDALEKLAQSSYDILFTDIQMPGMNGNELIEKVKPMHPEMIIIVLSGTIKEETEFVSQPNLFFIKPFTYDDTIKLLLFIIEKKPLSL